MLFFAFGKIRKQRAEIDRLDWNIKAVSTKAMQYKSTAGDFAERVNTLTLEKSELEMFNADLNNKVRELGIKNRELKNANAHRDRYENRHGSTDHNRPHRDEKNRAL